jgi:copper oxidase (laccase) domain-containing protein
MGAAGQADIFLPWKMFNNHPSPLHDVSDSALEIAARFHPAWDKLKPSVKKLHGRNVYQVLGIDLATPSKFVVCWTKDGKASGGTGQAMRIALAHCIPIFNLHNQNALKELGELVLAA